MSQFCVKFLIRTAASTRCKGMELFAAAAKISQPTLESNEARAHCLGANSLIYEQQFSSMLEVHIMYSRALYIVGIANIVALLSCLIGCGSVTPNSPDATPDAPPAMNTAYDIAYVYEFTVNPDTVGVDAFVLVINQGTTPLALSTARVASVDVDSGASLTFTKTTDSALMLAQGRAAGRVSPEAMAKLVTSGLTTEPIDDSNFDFTMNFSSLPLSGVVHSQVVLEIAAIKLDMPFMIHVDANAEPGFTTAQRLSARATP